MSHKDTSDQIREKRSFRRMQAAEEDLDEVMHGKTLRFLSPGSTDPLCEHEVIFGTKDGACVAVCFFAGMSEVEEEAGEVTLIDFRVIIPAAVMATAVLHGWDGDAAGQTTH